MDVSCEYASTLLSQYERRLTLTPSLCPHYVRADACREPELVPVYFVYEDQDELYYHAFHLARVNNTHYYDIQSPYGYGGPIATTENKDFLDCAWQEYLSYCQSQNVLAEFIRFHPLLENWKYYQGEIVFNRQTVWIDLNVDDLIASYHENRVRTAVRKGLKNNVRIHFATQAEFLPAFKQLYSDSMQRLKTSNFYFFNDAYIDAICNLETTCLSIATYENTIVTALISLIKDGILELHLLGTRVESNALCATNLIYHQTFIEAKKRGCHTVHFGGGAGVALDDPVLFFKRGYSNKIASFNIGKYIHQSVAYTSLANAHEHKTGAPITKVLFYRT